MASLSQLERLTLLRCTEQVHLVNSNAQAAFCQAIAHLTGLEYLELAAALDALHLSMLGKGRC